MDATLLLSGISASWLAVQTWTVHRDNLRAAAAFDERYQVALTDPTLLRYAKHISELIEQDLIDTMGNRAQTCWNGYREVLTGGFLPAEIDGATVYLKDCVCRELRRIHRFTGFIPSGELELWWNAYCGSK